MGCYNLLDTDNMTQGDQVVVIHNVAIRPVDAENVKGEPVDEREAGIEDVDLPSIGQMKPERDEGIAAEQMVELLFGHDESIALPVFCTNKRL